MGVYTKIKALFKKENLKKFKKNKSFFGKKNLIKKSISTDSLLVDINKKRKYTQEKLKEANKECSEIDILLEIIEDSENYTIDEIKSLYRLIIDKDTIE